jgi:hypothetical protein
MNGMPNLFPVCVWIRNVAIFSRGHLPKA